MERGHSVTALVRSPDRLKPFRDRITVKQGDLLNSAELEQVIQGHDAVLSGFGPHVPISKADASLLQRFALALTTAMRRAGVRRVVVESVAFLFTNSIMPPAYFLGRLFFPRTVADASAMEHLRGKRTRLDDGAPAPTHRQAVHRKVPRARGPPAYFRFQNLARGCGRLHDQGRRESPRSARS